MTELYPATCNNITMCHKLQCPVRSAFAGQLLAHCMCQVRAVKLYPSDDREVREIIMEMEFSWSGVLINVIIKMIAEEACALSLQCAKTLF